MKYVVWKWNLDEEQFSLRIVPRENSIENYFHYFSTPSGIIKSNHSFNVFHLRLIPAQYSSNCNNENRVDIAYVVPPALNRYTHTHTHTLLANAFGETSKRFRKKHTAGQRGIQAKHRGGLVLKRAFRSRSLYLFRLQPYLFYSVQALGFN